MIIERKQVIISAVVVLAILLLVWQFWAGSGRKQEVCPPDKCTFSLEDPPASFKALQPEAGLHREDYAPKAPPNFPLDLPLDPKPIKVLESYAETQIEQEGGDNIARIQITYVYVTNQTIENTVSSLQKYMQKNGYVIDSNEDDDYLKNTLIGRIDSVSANRMLTASFSYQNQFEFIVTVSYFVRTVYPSPAVGISP